LQEETRVLEDDFSYNADRSKNIDEVEFSVLIPVAKVGANGFR
jgi:hypothetical protein